MRLTAALLLVCIWSVLGCSTAEFSRVPEDKMVEVGKMVDQAKLEEGGSWKLTTALAEGNHCSIHALVVAKGCSVPESYFRDRDCVVFAHGGSAIVSVGGARYFAQAGTMTLVPAGAHLEIIQHESEEPFRAMVLISPWLGGAENHVMVKKKAVKHAPSVSKEPADTEQGGGAGGE